MDNRRVTLNFSWIARKYIFSERIGFQFTARKKNECSFSALKERGKEDAIMHIVWIIQCYCLQTLLLSANSLSKQRYTCIIFLQMAIEFLFTKQFTDPRGI